MEKSEPVKIAGAGPSGLAAALTLANAGHKVEVYERGKDCALRFRGDLQGLENWSEKMPVLDDLGRMGIEINFDCDPFSIFEITDGKRTRKVSSGHPFFYLVKRGPIKGSLDTGLKQQALEAGAKIFFNTPLQPQQADIVATGTIVKKALGIAKGIVFESSAQDIAVCLLDKKAAYRGYSYLLITKGYGCMCTAICGDFTRVNDCYEETRKILTSRYAFDVKNSKIVGGIVSMTPHSTFRLGGQLYVGEAAGIQDALAGFGIRSALKSGHLAAKSLMEGFDYEKAAKESFRPRMLASVVNRFLFESMYSKPVIRAGMRGISASKNPLSSLHKMYNLGMKTPLLPIAEFFLKRKYKKAMQ